MTEERHRNRPSRSEDLEMLDRLRVMIQDREAAVSKLMVRAWGAFKCYVTPWGWVGVSFPRKKRYEGVRFNVISVTRCGGVKFPGKKRYVSLEWPLVR